MVQNKVAAFYGSRCMRVMVAGKKSTVTTDADNSDVEPSEQCTGSQQVIHCLRSLSVLLGLHLNQAFSFVLV